MNGGASRALGAARQSAEYTEKGGTTRQKHGGRPYEERRGLMAKAVKLTAAAKAAG